MPNGNLPDQIDLNVQSVVAERTLHFGPSLHTRIFAYYFVLHGQYSYITPSKLRVLQSISIQVVLITNSPNISTDKTYNDINSTRPVMLCAILFQILFNTLQKRLQKLVQSAIFGFIVHA
jgi:hypothetical protein